MKANEELHKFILILILLAFAVVKLLFVHPVFSDENFYFNVAKNISYQNLPYRDFFFAHPPIQVFILSSIYKIFGISFTIGKLIAMVYSSACVLLTYTITKKLFGIKSAFFASMLFVASPPFIIFSDIFYGMWETMLYLLLSMLFILKRNLFTSSTFFILAIFTRYIAFFYIPIALTILYLRKLEIAKFTFFTITLAIILFLSFTTAFKSNYINQTLTYHLSKNRVWQIDQYLSIGLFFIILGILSVAIGTKTKNNYMKLIGLNVIIIDVLLLLSLKEIYYHYFLLSAPFYLIASSNIFNLDYNITKFTIFVVLLLSLIHNYQTIDFYLNPSYAKKFYFITNLISMSTYSNNKIFGEPVMTNYVSFTTGRKISGNYIDSYIQHIKFEGINKTIQKLNQEKPEIIVEIPGYYSSIPELYQFIKTNYTILSYVNDTPSYIIYTLKR